MIPMGITDEAGDAIAEQIRAARCLGWSRIELRKLNGAWLWQAGEDACAQAADALAAAGIAVHTVASSIGNPALRLLSEPAGACTAEAQVVARCCRRLGARFVRVMSYAIPADMPPAIEPERLRRLREACAVLVDAGLTPVHENCGNYGAYGPQRSRELCALVPGLRLCFDMANPLRDRAEGGAEGRVSPWDFWRQVRDLVAHIHIKDAFVQPDGAAAWCWPGAGQTQVVRILADAIHGGFAGGVSIEPHLGIGKQRDLPEAEARFRTFVAYGHRAAACLATARADLADGGLF
jgi:sugar phosphate isomerase/epimerase